MLQHEFSELLRTLQNGWTNRVYSSVAACFAEDVFYSDSVNYTIRDRTSLLMFFENDEGKPQSCIFRDHIFDEARQIGVAEYTYEGTFRYHGTVWIELRDDTIASWREYQHRSEKDWTEFWKK
jgi:hypothetical protein